MIARAGTLEDMARMLPRAPGRRAWRRFVVQAKRTAMVAVEDQHGLATVGGLYDDGSGELEAWMLIRETPFPRARLLALAAAQTLLAEDHALPVICHVRADRPAHRRFAEFVGFVSQPGEGPTILGRQTIRMIWIPG
jgi:hypothetical protein